ncbi:MAG: ATP-grasp domain-containing protein [Alphaproteobacteria bacterium]|nr:ATP-grasp domain-containing protein [Alphaproteobacteria bacterium]MDE2111229.1 ATP-grasp domain-containing protein [Alphaproteobacteria bacterium]MDE2492595.1 ATP-grasp domain-containing protein [Alphaproteobacteria bacterium]
MTQRILLATTVKWPSAAYLAGAFASLGCRVEALFPRGHVLAASRHVSRAHGYHPLRSSASFAAAVAAAKPDIVVPCDDRAVTLLLSLRPSTPDFSALLERSLGRIESYPVMMARSGAIAAARAEGVAAPLTVPVSDEHGLLAALESVGLPAVLKTDGSWGGGSVAVVHSREQARKAFRKLSRMPSRLHSVARAVRRRDAHFLQAAYRPHAAAVHLQQFVKGRPATSAFACRDGEVLAAVHVDVAAWQGATGPAALLKRTNCPRMNDAARRIARRFGLNGLQGLDFVRDEAGTPQLIEINPRATQICHLAFGAGCDLPAALLGLPPRATVTDKQLIALFPQEWLRNPSELPPAGAYRDVPWDDPGVVAAVGVDPLKPAGWTEDWPLGTPSLRPRRSAF